MSDIKPFVSVKVKEEVEYEDESYDDRQSNNSHLEDIDQNNALHGHLIQETTQDKRILFPLEMIKKESYEDVVDVTCDKLGDADECYQSEEINQEDEQNMPNGHSDFDINIVNNTEMIQEGRRNVPVEKVIINAKKAKCKSKSVIAVVGEKVNNIEKMTASKTHKCEMCGIIFTQNSSLNMFLKVQKTVTKNFLCDTCKSSYAPDKKIDTEKKPIKCDICGKCFTRKDSLKKHLRIHNGIKPFKCDICEKCFTQKTHLKEHLTIHSLEKPFKCTACEKTFTNRGNLNSHLRTHIEEKTFKCELCGKFFKQKGDLKKHQLIHTGAKPFKCHICGTCFRWIGNLKAHLESHAKGKQYKCHMCGKAYSRKEFLNLHIQMHTVESSERDIKVCKESMDSQCLDAEESIDIEYNDICKREYKQEPIELEVEHETNGIFGF